MNNCNTNFNANSLKTFCYVQILVFYIGYQVNKDLSNIKDLLRSVYDMRTELMHKQLQQRKSARNVLKV